MGRSPFARNNALWISALTTVIGLVFTVFAFFADYNAANWTDVYESLVPQETSAGSWNLLVRVVAPVVLVSGAWYLGEQIMARRTFNRLINEEKKSAFQDNLEELEDAARKLPKEYEERLDERTEQVISRRR